MSLPALRSMTTVLLLAASACGVSLPPPAIAHPAVAPLRRLEQRLVDDVPPAEALVDASLAVCWALPGERRSALPRNARELAEAAAFFDWENGDTLGQHLFSASLWDDAIEALARAAAEVDAAVAAEAAAAVAATARFVLLPPAERDAALDALAAAVASDAFLAARRAALATAKQQRREAAAASSSERAAEVFAAARLRRVRQDFVAVAPPPADDERIVRALYAVAVRELSAGLLGPLGFPTSKLGLRSLVAASRHAGSQRGAAALGTVWHAADEPAPLIVRAGAAAAAAAPAPSTADGAGALSSYSPISGIPTLPSSARTLVLVFSSLGWHGVVRAEYAATLRAVGDDTLVLAHCLDTAQSWYMTDPYSGEYDDGRWWDATLSALCAPYGRVCILGESMGATAALRFSRHASANGAVVALVPQIDVRDFDYSGRDDFGDARKERLRADLVSACAGAEARIVLHVGQDPPDLRQLDYLPPRLLASERVRVVRHAVAGHALGAGLKHRGVLRRTVLSDLLGHTYRLPPAGERHETCELDTKQNT
ncbi:hypothetical protein EMIHUDRAFT_114692 [Emiliania huxleyi CCMP1516]|uniref:Peptidase S9 prolyl oligopeptidase catalytic domain-containing protein n=3 Tax=Emiliania huxleyi TaxID=2903 RepID=A0A0D3JUZ5_EMIH1|nr:hypothetical protein EMIHUDRAFT_114692 [Emiliania huxleyi CCMP1516]EOD27330.1 hypothetical protein EMIHUDRAFT_114692 [Emiliania huxleyi CCMP1516]|eukprot:XP_005779759.1 hypothetical protein EMIHUDRAFT_114692 [Emiliania huxleyi CCMP1516]